ncbi:MAG: N-acetylmuramoyl-L-alanine amidase [Chitinophagales bacterium]|nr:N-acetylmuramoyl-L-alanine amidase [Chitinophagales bacterium]
MRLIKGITIHCTAGYGDVESIKEFWKKKLGWKVVGYHFFIYEDGRVVQLAPLSTVTNGVKGYNSDRVHIAYQGGVEKGNVKKAKDTRTIAQKLAIESTIENVIRELHEHQDVSKLEIKGHRDFSPDQNKNGIIDPWERIKECPSFDALSEYRALLRKFISVLLAVLLIGFTGCKSSKISTERIVTDSTTVTNTIIERDTIIVTNSDTISIMLDCKTTKPATLKGSKNAMIKTTPLGEKTLVKCTCDTMQIMAKLKELISNKERVTKEIVYKTTTNKPSIFNRYITFLGWLFIVLFVFTLIIQIIKIFR